MRLILNLQFYRPQDKKSLWLLPVVLESSIFMVCYSIDLLKLILGKINDLDQI